MHCIGAMKLLSHLCQDSDVERFLTSTGWKIYAMEAQTSARQLLTLYLVVHRLRGCMHLQAAAHGVPTVATKNGGPVDIMTTLHHGLLVDPNSSKEIADALVKILTEPKEWEEMSQNGIKNIMAYSWPSHCKQVLESLEKEKQYIKTHTVSCSVALHHAASCKVWQEAITAVQVS